MESSAEHTQMLQDVSASTIYMMGGSFLLGSLFTILILMFLDFIRRRNAI